MAKRLRVNKKKWPNKSAASIRSFHTRQRGYVYWNDEKVDGCTPYMWKGHEFFAVDWSSACDYIHEIKETITDY